MIINSVSKDPRISYPVPDVYTNRISIGVDWGDKSYVTVGTVYKGMPLIIGMYRIDADDPDEHPKEVARIMMKYNADIAVCDAGYGRDRNAKLLKAFPEKIFSCFYPNSERGSKIFEPQWQDDQSKVSVDRTNSLKLSLGYFRAGEAMTARNIEQRIFQQFTRHLANLVSVKDIDEKTGEIQEWIANMGQDHFGHSYNYMIIGISKFDKLPKSEYWDGAREISEAIKEKKKIVATDVPEVPGMGSMQTIMEKSIVKGILHGECYGTKYDTASDKCFNCRQGRSCRDICNGGGTLIV
jgi:hypothetical protein